MSYFTDSPFERMMQDTTREAPERPAPPRSGHPCYGCGNYPGPCVSCWKKALVSWQAEQAARAADTQQRQNNTIQRE